jgi:hypothetical protein
MISSILYFFTLLNLFTLYGIGTSISIIAAIREKKTNSPGESIVLIVIGSAIVALAGLIAAFMGIRGLDG